MNKIKLIGGRSNPELAELISKQLGIPLTSVIYKDFGNSETYVQIEQTVRKCNVFIIQTGGAFEGRSINDHIIELYQLIDACKLSGAKSISVVLPTYPYSRSDKKDKPRQSIMASFIARQLTDLGVTRIISLDLHTSQIAGFTNIPFDNLYAIKLHIDYLKSTLFNGLSQEEINQKYVLCAPDAGAAKKIEEYAKRLGMNHVIMHKHRDYTKSSTVLNSQLIGDPEYVKNKTILMIDDIIDSGNTMIIGGNELEKYGANGMIIIATHGVFSGKAIENLTNCKMILKVIVTNTLPQKYNTVNKLEIVDASNLFSQVIKRIQNGESVSELFE